MNRPSTIRILIATSAAAVLLSSTTRASLIWDGNASQGISVFKNLNIQDSSDVYQGNPSPNGSSVTTLTDGSEGTVFKFDKAVNDRRCEAHGANNFTPAIGNTYYIGWRFKLTSLVDDNAVFQWKSYGSPMVQNFPLIVKMVGGKLTLHYFPPSSGDVVLWSQTISANTYNSMVLRIAVSDQTTSGSVSFWFNGTAQTLSNGSTSYTGKTFDGSAVDPKWGIYGATSTHVTDYVSHLKIGTTYADVNPISTPDFSISASPSSQSVTAGNGTTYTATVSALNGFNSGVSFSVSGLPSGASGSFNPTSVTGSGSSTLSVTTSASTTPGTYILTVTGTSGSLAHGTMVTLVVNPQANPDFSLSASPNSLTVVQGDNGQSTITVNPINGFTSSVSL